MGLDRKLGKPVWLVLVPVGFEISLLCDSMGFATKAFGDGAPVGSIQKI